MKRINRKKYLYLLPSIILSLLLSLNTFWSKPLVPGFDAPFYLTEIRNFSQNFPNPLTYRYLDRYLTIAFPGLLSKIFELDPVSSYRIAITAVYIGIAVSLFYLFKNITKKNSLAMVLSSAIIISPFLLNYTLLYANFAAFLILFTFFAIETGRNFKHKDIVLGFLLGILFYTHNFSTVSFGLIFAFYFLLKFIAVRDTKILKSAVIIFILAGLIGFIEFSRYLGIDLTFSHAVNIGLPGQPVNAGNIKDLIFSSVLVYTGKFWLLYFGAFILTCIVFFRGQIFENKKKFLIPAVIFIPSFILSFQPLFHLSYLPERFATLACLSTYFFYITVITLPTFKKLLIPLAVMPLFLNYLSSDSLILNKGYRSFNQEEIEVYQNIATLMNKEASVVLIPSNHSNWGQYFLEDFDVKPGEHFVSCGNIKERGWINETNFTFAMLLAEKDQSTAESLISYLKSLLPNKIVYILTDTSLPCGHGKILSSLTEVKQLYNQGSWYLYEIN